MSVLPVHDPSAPIDLTRLLDNARATLRVDVLAANDAMPNSTYPPRTRRRSLRGPRRTVEPCRRPTARHRAHPSLVPDPRPCRVAHLSSVRSPPNVEGDSASAGRDCGELISWRLATAGSSRAGLEARGVPRCRSGAGLPFDARGSGATFGTLAGGVAWCPRGVIFSNGGECFGGSHVEAWTGPPLTVRVGRPQCGSPPSCGLRNGAFTRS